MNQLDKKSDRKVLVFCTECFVSVCVCECYFYAIHHWYTPSSFSLTVNGIFFFFFFALIIHLSFFLRVNLLSPVSAVHSRGAVRSEEQREEPGEAVMSVIRDHLHKVQKQSKMNKEEQKLLLALPLYFFIVFFEKRQKQEPSSFG